jgi:hypothetical protein
MKRYDETFSFSDVKKTVRMALQYTTVKRGGHTTASIENTRVFSCNPRIPRIVI